MTGNSPLRNDAQSPLYQRTPEYSVAVIDEHREQLRACARTVSYAGEMDSDTVSRAVQMLSEDGFYCVSDGEDAPMHLLCGEAAYASIADTETESDDAHCGGIPMVQTDIPSDVALLVHRSAIGWSTYEPRALTVVDEDAVVAIEPA